MRVRYTLRARADLEDIFSYIDERSPVSARAVRAEIRRRIDQLPDFPLLAPETEMPGERELSVSRFRTKSITKFAATRFACCTSAAHAAVPGLAGGEQ